MNNISDATSSDRQAALLQNALSVVRRVPPSVRAPGQPEMLSQFVPPDRDEQAFKNMWNFNLPDAAYGWVLLNINDGRVSAETRSQGFNFSYRKTNAQIPQTSSPAMSTTGIIPPGTNISMGGGSLEQKPNEWQQNAVEPRPSSAENDWKDNASVKDSPNPNRNSKRMSVASILHHRCWIYAEKYSYITISFNSNGTLTQCLLVASLIIM